MFKNKVHILINDYHIKKIALINLIDSNKVTFDKKMKDNTFSGLEQSLILSKYGALLR